MRRFPLFRSVGGLVGGVIVAVFLLTATFGPHVVPKDPYDQDLARSLQPPSREHWLGTDQYGRDVFSRIVCGSRVSLMVALGAVLFGVAVGAPLGAIAGYAGGKVDTVLMRLVDVGMSFPYIILAIFFVAIAGTSLAAVIMAVGLVSVPTFARLARGSVLAIRDSEHVIAARALGSGDLRILARHIAPNIVAPITVQATFSMAASILSAGGLSFLGLGVQPPHPEWGAMLAMARGYIRIAPHLVMYPGAALAVVVLGINLLGDALREAVDPRLRR